MGQARKKYTQEYARKKYTQEYKDEAVELVISSGRPIAEIARDLGINEGTLANWVNTARKSGKVKEKPLDTDERARLGCTLPGCPPRGQAGRTYSEAQRIG